MPHIPVISYEESSGRLREIYDQLIGSRGKLAAVHQIQSLRPESIVKHMDLYMEIMFSRSDLSRARREMLATVCSAANGCSYCQNHHGTALNHYWKDSERVAQLRKNWRGVENLSAEDQCLCAFAERLSLKPTAAEKEDFTEPLRRAGFSEAAILDAHLVVAYFNFVNRLVLGLGVGLESEGTEGYRY